jgi:GNAT superfamily N-acetyltransferase
MTCMHVTPELIARIDRFSVRFHAARMTTLASLPNDPCGVEIFTFSDGLACKVKHHLLRSKNRILGFISENLDILDDLILAYKRDGLNFLLCVPSGQTTPYLFQKLVEAGMWSAGSGTMPALIPSNCLATEEGSLPPNITIRRSGLDEKELYLDLFQQAFADREESDPEYRDFQWAEDTLGVRYIAEAAGNPVAMASFPIIDGTGFLGTCGVLPEYRGRGIHRALIDQRIADASGLGCDLVLGGGSPGSTEYRNFERAGLTPVPTGSWWRMIPA